jgi:hypothetical protein
MDRRYNDINIFLNSGMKFIENTLPDFVYVLNNKIYDKNNIKKELLCNSKIRKLYNSGYSILKG